MALGCPEVISRIGPSRIARLLEDLEADNCFYGGFSVYNVS